MAFDLAKNRINLLGIEKLDFQEYVVMFEYQYVNKDKSRVWQKDIMVYENKDLSDLCKKIPEYLVDYVKQARAELEK